MSLSLPLALVIMMCLGSTADSQPHMTLLQEALYLGLMGGMAVRVERTAAHMQRLARTSTWS